MFQCPCQGRISTLKTSSCPWHWVPGRSKFETGQLFHHYMGEILLNVMLTCNQPTNPKNCIHEISLCLYCKHGYFHLGKISQNCWQDLSQRSNFHNTTPISLARSFEFIFTLGNFHENITKNAKITAIQIFQLRVLYLRPPGFETRISDGNQSHQLVLLLWNHIQKINISKSRCIVLWQAYLGHQLMILMPWNHKKSLIQQSMPITSVLRSWPMQIVKSSLYVMIELLKMTDVS